MKIKLTLTVDKDLLPVAKRCARARGRSLSQFVEGALKSLVQTEGGPTFAEKWRGKFKPARRNTPLYRALAKKYL